MGGPPRGNDGAGGLDLLQLALPPLGWAGSRVRPWVPSPPSPWPSWDTHGDLFPPPHHLAPITADR